MYDTQRKYGKRVPEITPSRRRDRQNGRAMATFDEGISETLSLLRRKGGMTRTEIVAETGLSRSAVNLRIDALLEGRLVAGSAREAVTKGRPAEVFSFNSGRGKLLAADVGATKFRAGLCNL